MSDSTTMKILYEDDYIVAIEKPLGVAVHRNEFMPKDKEVVLSLLGKTSKNNLYPIHRLDAKTSGVLLISKDANTTSKFSHLFESNQIKKVYKAICKGNPGEGTWDNDVRAGKNVRKMKTALTNYVTEKIFDLYITLNGEDLISPISLISLFPQTGRWHQLRQHCGYNRHDILGDRQHGDWDLNKALASQYHFSRMFLHAHSLNFLHPITNKEIRIVSELPGEFNQLMKKARLVSSDYSKHLDSSG